MLVRLSVRARNIFTKTFRPVLWSTQSRNSVRTGGPLPDVIGKIVKLNTRFHLVPTLRICGVIPPCAICFNGLHMDSFTIHSLIFICFSRFRSLSVYVCLHSFLLAFCLSLHSLGLPSCLPCTTQRCPNVLLC